MEPAGVLKNKQTGRFHPIVFRPAPMASQADKDSGALRHRSRGHHTEGFDTLDSANAFIEENKWKNCGAVWEWDGNSIPALTQWFSPT